MKNFQLQFTDSNRLPTDNDLQGNVHGQDFISTNNNSLYNGFSPKIKPRLLPRIPRKLRSINIVQSKSLNLVNNSSYCEPTSQSEIIRKPRIPRSEQAKSLAGKDIKLISEEESTTYINKKPIDQTKVENESDCTSPTFAPPIISSLFKSNSFKRICLGKEESKINPSSKLSDSLDSLDLLSTLGNCNISNNLIRCSSQNSPQFSEPPFVTLQEPCPFLMSEAFNKSRKNEDFMAFKNWALGITKMVQEETVNLKKSLPHQLCQLSKSCELLQELISLVEARCKQFFCKRTRSHSEGEEEIVKQIHEAQTCLENLNSSVGNWLILLISLFANSFEMKREFEFWQNTLKYKPSALCIQKTWIKSMKKWTEMWINKFVFLLTNSKNYKLSFDEDCQKLTDLTNTLKSMNSGFVKSSSTSKMSLNRKPNNRLAKISLKNASGHLSKFTVKPMSSICWAICKPSEKSIQLNNNHTKLRFSNNGLLVYQIGDQSCRAEPLYLALITLPEFKESSDLPECSQKLFLIQNIYSQMTCWYPDLNQQPQSFLMLSSCHPSFQQIRRMHLVNLASCFEAEYLDENMILSNECAAVLLACNENRLCSPTTYLRLHLSPKLQRRQDFSINPDKNQHLLSIGMPPTLNLLKINFFRRHQLAIIVAAVSFGVSAFFCHRLLFEKFLFPFLHQECSNFCCPFDDSNQYLFYPFFDIQELNGFFFRLSTELQRPT